MRARRRQQARHGVGDRPPVALPVEIAQHRKRPRDLGEGRRQLVRQLAERMERAEAMAEREERAVAEREQRTVQRREYREVVVGTLDRRERVADRLHLLALVEGAAADEDVGKVPCFERAHVLAADVAIVRAEAPEEQADVMRLDRHALLWPLALRNRPAAVPHQPLDERGGGIGQRVVDLPVHDGAEIAVWRRHGQRDDRGLLGVRPRRGQRHVRRLTLRAVTHP